MCGRDGEGGSRVAETMIIAHGRWLLIVFVVLFAQPHFVREKVVVELGSGPGLTGLVAALVGAKRVFLTDHLEAVLQNATKNAKMLMCQRPCGRGGPTNDSGHYNICVRKLDWFEVPFCINPLTSGCAAGDPRFEERRDLSAVNAFLPTAAEAEEMRSADVYLAADAVYDDDITGAFFATLNALLPASAATSDRCCLFAIARRLNFSAAECRVVATGYDRLMEHLQRGGAWMAKQIKIQSSIPQAFRDYERNEFLELWHIRRAAKEQEGEHVKQKVEK